MTTIRRRLLSLLLPALAVLMFLGGVADYWVATVTTRDAYDQGLASMALAASTALQTDQGQLRVNPMTAQAALSQHAGDGSPLFSIVGPRHEVLAGIPDLPMATAVTTVAPDSMSSTQHLNGGIAFRDATYQGMHLRVATLRTRTEGGPIAISVAETQQRRTRTQRVMLIGKLLVDFAEFDIALLVIWFGIYYGLRPLTRLQERIEQVSGPAPERLDESDVPGELRPLMLAFNHVLDLLRHAALTQRRFVADAAHQMRTPLAGLLAQSELPPGAGGTDLQERLANINRGAQHLAHTANQLLAMARADSVTRSSKEFALVDLRPQVEQLVERNLDRAVAAGLDLGTEAQEAQVTGNAWLLEDLLGNLIDNALKYTPAGGRVTVRSGIEHDRPFLEVEDDGPGIPEAERPRVRERFYRSPGTRGAGCGLGLAIVSEIAEKHGARFTIDTPVTGRGTLMRVKFPPAT